MATTTVNLRHLDHITLKGASVQRHGASKAAHQRGRILLNTRNSLLLLCPLLPLDKPKHALAIPEEVWRRILEIVMADTDVLVKIGITPNELLRVCKMFKVRYNVHFMMRY